MPEPLCPKARLNVATVKSFHADLLARKGQDIVCDLSAVTQLGALALQALIAAGRNARAEGKTLKLINTPDRVLEQLRTMGMSPETIMEGRS